MVRVVRLLTEMDVSRIDRPLFMVRTNASYQVGLSMITQYQRRALGALTPPETFFRTGKVAGA